MVSPVTNKYSLFLEWVNEWISKYSIHLKIERSNTYLGIPYFVSKSFQNKPNILFEVTAFLLHFITPFRRFLYPSKSRRIWVRLFVKGEGN